MVVVRSSLSIHGFAAEGPGRGGAWVCQASPVLANHLPHPCERTYHLQIPAPGESRDLSSSALALKMFVRPVGEMPPLPFYTKPMTVVESALYLGRKP